MSRRVFLEAMGAAGLGVAVADRLASGAPVPGPAFGDGPSSRAAADPVGDLAAALDYDPERIFRWVADEVRYEPYAGILRGTHGTLNSRAGNSADQALLLAALLDAALIPYRFATGSIDEATADALLTSGEADLDGIRRHGTGALAGRIPGQDPPAPALTPEQQARIDEALADAGPVIAWAREQLDGTVTMITAALAGAGIDLPSGHTPVPDLERTGHIWVQSAATADWIDLDPSLPGSEPGTTLATETTTLDALPEELAHQVEISVIGETLTAGGLTERRLVGYAERADLLAGLPIEIANTRPEAMAALGVSIAGVLGGGTAYVPSILVGDVAVVGANPITFAGGPESDPGAGDGVLDTGASAGETTAQWVELAIRSPGAEPVVTRHELFDRIGPARRSVGGVSSEDLAPVDWMDDPVDGGSHPLPALSAHWLTVATGLPGRDDRVMAIVPGEDGRDRALVAQAHHILTAAAGTEVAAPAGIRSFLDAPNVTACSVVPRRAPDGQPVVDIALDIWHRSFGTGMVVGVLAAHAPAVATGVLAHIAERVPGWGAAAAATSPGMRPPVSVGAVFDRARDEAVPLRVLRGGGATGDLPWTDDARARLEAWLALGWVAVAPERAVVIGDRERLGWWLVDPRSGRTVDALDDGRGGSAFEEAATIASGPVSLSVHAYRMFGFCLLGAVVTVTGAVFLGAGAADAVSGNAPGAFFLGFASASQFWAGAILLGTC